MGISTIFVVKNALKQGYCFWESLLSCLPFSTELIISEGFSDDNTMKYLIEFKKRYGSQLPIYIHQDEWETVSYHGEVISKVTHRAMERATQDWILNLQADEIYHEDIIEAVRNVAKSLRYNSVNFRFKHLIRGWQPCSNPAYAEAVRMVRRDKEPKLKGDAWTFEIIAPVCSLISAPVYHFASCFSRQNDIKDIDHAVLYQNVPEYKERMQRAIQSLKQEKQAYPSRPIDFQDFPELSMRFAGAAEYKPPIEI